MRRLSLLLLLAALATGCGAADDLAVAGAAAGAVVGGCSLLDADNDDAVTSTEVANGLFARYDSNSNGVLTRAEFNAGVARGRTTAAWRGEFDGWDDNDDGLLSRPEFVDAATGDGGLDGAADDTCDDLGL